MSNPPEEDAPPRIPEPRQSPTVPQPRPSDDSAAKRDVVGFLALAAVILGAVPAAISVLPNTVSYVVPTALRDLGLADGQAGDLVRACGLALPALLLVVPVAGVVARRTRAWPVLFAGLMLLVGAEAAAAYVPGVLAVGGVRVAEGAGAGLVLPATLALTWERRERRTGAGLWAGALVASLLLATPLALHAIPTAGGVAWRSVLHPYGMLAPAALIVTGLYGLLRLRRTHRPVVPPARHNERAQLLLPVVPAAGFSFLAVFTTYGWSPGAQLIVAALGVAGLLGMAMIGSRDAGTGSPLGYPVVMLAAGLLSMPLAGPLAGLLAAGGGPGHLPLPPFAAGAGCAVAGALVAVATGAGAGRGVVLAGYALSIVAALLFLTVGATTGQWFLLVPLCLLGAGAGLAVAAALRRAEVGGALFGLSLCFPAVLTGHLIVGPLQIAKVTDATRAGGTAADALYALTAGFRLWLITAGVLAVLLAAATGWVTRERTGRNGVPGPVG